MFKKIDSLAYQNLTPLPEHNHDSLYYRKNYIDITYYTKNQIDTNLNSYYTKSQTDTSFSNYYTQTQIDSSLSNYYTKNESDSNLNNKQNILVSGTNLKTINNQSLLGSGDITISGGGGGGVPAGVDITINRGLIGNGDNTYNNNQPFNYKWGIENYPSNYYGKYLLAIGTYALQNNGTGSYNIAIGCYALQSSSGNVGCNTAIGFESCKNNSDGQYNTAIGHQSMSNAGGTQNTSLGYLSLYYANSSSSYNTAVGAQALVSANGYTNCSGIGYGSEVSGSNQIQLGNGSTTTYVYGTVQNRSDLRDKADIRDTNLGLDFILNLRPVDYKWNLREDYIENKIIDKEIEVTLEDGTVDKQIIQELIVKELPNDGSKKRTRYHHGFIAQDFIDKDFGGFQDHSLKGGKEVMSIGYDEFIAPLVKAIQEQQVMINSLKKEIDELKKI